jgi:hypothetical protein
LLIDLTKKPLIVYPEECASSVVVRTIGNQIVAGILRRGKHDLPPGAKVTRGKSTLYESRIPLYADADVVMTIGGRTVPSRRSVSRFGTMRTRELRPGERPPEFEEQPAIKLTESFEVATVCHDALTDFPGTWRIGIRVEFVPKLKKAPWVVSMQEIGDETRTLATIAVASLDPAGLPETLPLNRAIQKTIQPANAWTKILDDDTD